MASGRLSVYRAIPNPAGLMTTLRHLTGPEGGMVTAFDDGVLPALQEWLGENDDVEVMPFGAVVLRHLRLAGEPAYDLAQGALHRAAIHIALQSLDDDSVFAASRRFLGAAEAIQSTLKELHAWGLGPEELEHAALGVSQDFAQKLRDLAQVDRESRSVLSDLGRALHTDHLLQCQEGLLIEDEGVPRYLFVVVGAEVHPGRIAWLKWAAEMGTRVTVFLDGHASDGRLFPGADLAERLLGVTPKKMGSGPRLLERLFTEANSTAGELDVRLTSSPDRMAEAEWVLRRANELGGDCAIYTRTLEDYAPYLEAASRRFGIPISMGRRAPLLTNAFARLTLTLLEWCLSPDIRGLIPVLRSSYVGLSRDSRNQFESALRECHRSRDQQWSDLELWASQQEESLPWLGKVLQWRREAVGRSADLAAWLDQLRQIVHELPWHQTDPGGVRYAITRDARAFTVMQRVVAEQASIDRVTTPQPYSLKRFVSLCRESWESADVSIPSSDAGIRVASEPYGLTGAEHVFVLGLLEGTFPRRRVEDPVLTDREREALSLAAALDPPLLTSHDKMTGERDLFYRVCAAPLRSLELSYPEADDDRDNIPAFFIEAVKRAMAEPDDTMQAKVATLAHRRSEWVPGAADRILEADQRLAAALEGPRDEPLPVELGVPTTRESLTPVPPIELSPDQIRTVLNCPFQAAFRHQLTVHPEVNRSRWRRLQRLPEAANLTGQPTEEAARSALKVALEVELDRLYPETTEWERTLLAAGGERLIEDWLSHEFAARDRWKRQPGSSRQNVSFGESGLRSDLPAGVKLKGKVSAVSRIEDPVSGVANVVHLYGTTPPQKAPIEDDAEAAFYGAHLLAVWRKGEKAMLELESPGKDRTMLMVSRGQWRLPTINQLGLKAMPIGEEGEEGEDGDRAFIERVKRLFARAMETVGRGEIRPTPGPHCQYCDYGELCRRSDEFSEEDPSPFGADIALSKGGSD